MTEGDGQNERFWRLGNPLVWTLGATVFFFVVILWFGLAPTCNVELFPEGECPPKWRHLYVAPPNEVGDTLAGLAGVLAFIWLIGTVLLQSIELREQRKEFREQRKATQDMARAMAAQAAIFEDEKRQRDEQRAEELFDQLLISLCGMNERADGPRWDYFVPNEKGGGTRSNFSFDLPFSSQTPVADQVGAIVSNGVHSSKLLMDYHKRKFIEKYPEDTNYILELRRLAARVIALKTRLSEAQVERLASFEMDQLIKACTIALEEQYLSWEAPQ